MPLWTFRAVLATVDPSAVSSSELVLVLLVTLWAWSAARTAVDVAVASAACRAPAYFARLEPGSWTTLRLSTSCRNSLAAAPVELELARVPLVGLLVTAPGRLVFMAALAYAVRWLVALERTAAVALGRAALARGLPLADVAARTCVICRVCAAPFRDPVAVVGCLEHVMCRGCVAHARCARCTLAGAQLLPVPPLARHAAQSRMPTSHAERPRAAPDAPTRAPAPLLLYPSTGWPAGDAAVRFAVLAALAAPQAALALQIFTGARVFGYEPLSFLARWAPD